jgi:hypothetical protein
VNLNNNHRINSSIIKTNNNLKAMCMRILLLATTFLMYSNASETVFAQSGNSVVGCANTVKVTISHLPPQTDDASTEVILSNLGPSDDQGTGGISIPGIGSGHLKVYFHIASVREYGATVSDILGQTDGSPATRLSEAAVCNSESPQSGFLYIPGIGSGSLAMTKVN